MNETRALTSLPKTLTTMVGRQQDVEKLQRIFQQEQITVLLNGLGGVGKTTLASCFLSQKGKDYNFLAWIPFEGNLEASLVKSLNPHFQFKGDQEVIYRLILSEVKKLPGKKLFVLDNLNDMKEAEKLRALPEGLKVLITSRLELDFYNHRVETLPFSEAKELFLKHAQRKIEESLLRELFDLIGYHTLMIEMLAKTYADSEIELTSLISFLAKKDFEKKPFQEKLPLALEEKQVLQHISSLFKCASLSSKEIFLLRQLSILSSTEKISPAKLCEFFQIKKHKIPAILESLEQLFQKGWLQKYKDSFYCHEMIRIFVLHHSSIIPSIQHCKDTMTYFTQELGKEENYWVVELLPLLDHSTSIVKALFQEGQTHIADLCYQVGLAYNYLGQYEKASSYLEKALLCYTQIYGEFDRKTASAWDALGIMWEGLGKYEQAAEHHEKAIKYYEKTIPNDFKDSYDHLHHGPLTRYYNHLGTVWSRLGKYQKAIQLYSKSLEINLKIYGSQHPQVAETEEVLGYVWGQLGEYEKALEFLQKALTIDLAIYGSLHPRIGSQYGNIGKIWINLGNYEKAVDFLQQALDNNIKIYGPKHPNVAIALNNLGWAWKEFGNYEKTVELLQQSLDIYLPLYGEKHPYISIAWINLGIGWLKLEEYQKAKVLFRNSLKSDLKTYGKHHPQVGNCWSNLGNLYREIKRYSKSRKFLKIALQIFTQSYGKEHPHVAALLHYLGETQEASGDIESAASYYQQSLSIYQKSFGKNHVKTHKIKKNLNMIQEKLSTEIEKTLTKEKLDT